jgi:hypothetical protein
MGGVVAAGLTGKDQRRQQHFRFSKADDQHLKTSLFPISPNLDLRHILKYDYPSGRPLKHSATGDHNADPDWLPSNRLLRRGESAPAGLTTKAVWIHAIVEEMGQVMRKTLRLAAVMLFCCALLVLSACAAGPNEAQADQGAGFWLGLWHGLISPITFVVSLFTETVNVYEVQNNGNWYDFGFMLGVMCAFSGGGAGGAATTRRKRK